MQLQTYYKHLQTKPTNCKKVATNYKNVATNANKHLQTKPTNTQKVTTNANKRQQTELGEMGLLHSYNESNYKHLQTPTNFVTTNLLQTPTN